MDEFKNITDNLKKSFDQLVDLNERTSAKIANRTQQRWTKCCATKRRQLTRYEIKTLTK